MTTKLDVSLCMTLEKYFIQCVLLGKKFDRSKG